MRSTALKQFTKLESTGLWREAPELQRREVIVNFGEASLTRPEGPQYWGAVL